MPEDYEDENDSFSGSVWFREAQQSFGNDVIGVGVGTQITMPYVFLTVRGEGCWFESDYEEDEAVISLDLEEARRFRDEMTRQVAELEKVHGA